ncbi:MAG: 7-cyano-7-deazaguanine synthase [Candidatus Diapherotrites archaeon]
MQQKKLASAIRREAKKGKAVVLCSGGVDSTVCAVLAKNALGSKAVFYFIDSGFQRKFEAQKAEKNLEKLGITLKIFNAGHCFSQLKKSRANSVERRALSLAGFSRAVELISKKEKCRAFIFGTTQDDLAASGKQSGANKSGFTIIEPLKCLEKKQVRGLAEQLGIPKKIIHAQHFPGPGLSLRVLGRLDGRNIALAQELHAFFEKKKNWLVGKKGDSIFFPFVIPANENGKKWVGIRALKQVNAETAILPELRLEKLWLLAAGILDEFPSVGRVLLDISPKPPAKMEML